MMTGNATDDCALEWAYRYAETKNKQWVINCMVRALTGKKYERWVAEWERKSGKKWNSGKPFSFEERPGGIKRK